MSTPTSEREDLEALIQSPGWQRFVSWAQDEYGAAILGRVADEKDEVQALIKLRQARAIQGAVQVLVEWPARRLSATAPTPAQSGPSRRGGL